MNDCIFCKIVSHTVPARIIAEDEWCLAIVPLDIEVDDHLVVLPKSHYLGMLDIPKAILHRTHEFTQKVCLALNAQAGYTGFNILHATGVDAQQSMPHFHVHILPRRNNDDINAWPKLPGGKSNVKSLSW